MIFKTAANGVKVNTDFSILGLSKYHPRDNQIPNDPLNVCIIGHVDEFMDFRICEFQ